MPRLPDIGERPVPRPSRDVAAPRPDLRDPGLGEGLSSVGRALIDVSEIARRQQERMDTLHAEDGYNRLQSGRLELEFSTDGNNPGFRNVRGRDALEPDFQNRVIEKFQENSKEIESSLLNDNQRRLFKRRSL